MSDKKQYYAVMAQQYTVVDKNGSNVQVVCFNVPEAVPEAINQHVRMFGWFNPAHNLYQVHEEKSGIMIGSGRTRDLALVDVAQFFRATDPKFFFKQAEVMGVATKNPEITYEAALASFRALKTRNLRRN